MPLPPPLAAPLLRRRGGPRLCLQETCGWRPVVSTQNSWQWAMLCCLAQTMVLPVAAAATAAGMAGGGLRRRLRPPKRRQHGTRLCLQLRRSSHCIVRRYARWHTMRLRACTTCPGMACIIAAVLAGPGPAPHRRHALSQRLAVHRLQRGVHEVEVPPCARHVVRQKVQRRGVEVQLCVRGLQVQAALNCRDRAPAQAARFGFETDLAPAQPTCIKLLASQATVKAHTRCRSPHSHLTAQIAAAM